MPLQVSQLAYIQLCHSIKFLIRHNDSNDKLISLRPTVPSPTAQILYKNDISNKLFMSRIIIDFMNHTNIFETRQFLAATQQASVKW